MRSLEFFKKEKIKPVAICDNDKLKWGNIIFEVEVTGINKAIERFDDFYIVITTLNYLDEIYTQLSEIIPKERIIFDTEIFIFLYHERLNKICDSFSDEKSKEVFYNILQLKINNNICKLEDLCILPQYFQDDIYKIKEDEVFLDVGSFTGDTIEVLEKITSGKYKKVIACEPNKENYTHIEKMMETNPKIQLIKKGISNKKETLLFTSDTSASNFNENGNMKIEVDTIDNLIDEPITFIKMDIEGFEMNALNGAINTIKKYKPALAISIYHKFTDFVDIPEFILNLNLGYKLYIRHHLDDLAETVLYAVSD